MGRPSSIHRAVNGHGSTVWRFRHQGRSHSRRLYADAVALYAKLVGTPAGAEKPILVAELIKNWTDAHPSRWHADMIGPFDDWAGDREIESLEHDVLSRYKAWIESQTYRRGKGKPQRYSLETIRKRVYAAAEALGGKFALPRLPIPVPEPNALDHKTIAAMLLGMQSSPRSKHVAELVRFAMDTGMRPGEVRGLRWSHVDTTRGAIVLPQHKTAARTGKPRVVAIPAHALARLRTLDRRGPYVFPNRSGQPYTRSGLQATLRRHGLAPNRLRHTFAQAMIDGNVRPEVVTEMLGHRTSRMVWTYAAIKAERIREAFDSVATPSQLADAAASQLRITARRKRAGRKAVHAAPRPESARARA